MENSYRLVWFQHLSKAAGTSIVQLAKINGEIFYLQNSNGNPRSSDGKLIRLWDMDAVALTEFIDHCEHEGVTFIATEWGGPDFTVLSSDPRVTLITCLRDPLERFVSNFYYAFYSGSTGCISLESYANSVKSLWGTYTMSNYYCRIFSRCHHDPKSIGQHQFELAKSNLLLFDCCVLLQGKSNFSQIKNMLGWMGDETHANRTKLDTLSLVKLMAKGKVRPLWRRFAYPKKEPGKEFIHHFREQNLWDYKFIQEAKKDVPD